MTFEQNRYKVRSKTHHAAGAGIRHLIDGDISLEEHLKKGHIYKGKNTIYIHVPFCTKICSFCNMRRSLIDPPSNYADLVVEQIKRYGQYESIQKREYDSIYFGGGTPTTLSTKDLRKVLVALKENFPITKQAEVSVETTLTELDEEKMEMLFEEGVNRFSIGIQTFSNKGRETLGRIGSGESGIEKINQLRNIGFSNINIDIIYNYPDQSIEELYKDIEIASSLDIAGFSFYSLILSDKAELIKSIASPDNYYNENFKKEIDGFNIITESAKKNGFDFLELTKMVRPGRDEYKYIKIKHGGGDTLPLGAGAGGSLGDVGIMNEVNVDKFKQQLKDFEEIKGIVFKPEYRIIKEISSKPQFIKLDTSEIDNDYIRMEVVKFFDELIEEGFAVKQDQVYKLTQKGIFWGNNICRELSQLVMNSLM